MDRGLLATKLRAAIVEMRHLPRAARLVWEASRPWTLLWIATLVAQGLLPAAVVQLTRALVDSLVASAAAHGEWPRVAETLALAGLMGAALLAGEVMHGAADWLRTLQARRVESHINRLVHGKSASVDIAFYESPEYHDHLHRARAEASHRPVALLENAGALIQSSITLAAMAAVLAPYGLWIPLALAASTAPALAVVLRFALRQHRWRLGATEEERRAVYHDWLMTAGETAQELRVFGLARLFRERFERSRDKLARGELRIAKDHAVADLGAGALGLLIAAASVAWMGLRVAAGQASLGDLALFYQAFSQGQRLMRTLLGGVGHAYYNLLFLGNLFAFLDLEQRIVDPPRPRFLPPGGGVHVRFRNVWFGYPGSDRTALRDLDLEIPAGQVAAIVGANGAGKSTLVKLLCRFHDPRHGAIELDGIDIRELRVAQLRAALTVLFQEPVRYSATVAENIGLQGDGAPVDPVRVRAAARAAGAEPLIERLPGGYETLLGKWFSGGVDMSTGEWQRLALARAFMRASRLILLDEPTSAMDSWAEAEWLRRFRDVAVGRTAIIVTHRFTTAMRADMIYVMSEGGLAERGSHAELLALGGAYARSWREQMRAEHGAPVA